MPKMPHFSFAMPRTFDSEPPLLESSYGSKIVTYFVHFLSNTHLALHTGLRWNILTYSVKMLYLSPVCTALLDVTVPNNNSVTLQGKLNKVRNG